MSRRFLITVITLVVILTAGGAAILLAKGYTLDPKQGKLTTTGIISATSLPDGASVYIDGHLTTATNSTVPSLIPKTYNVRIYKEGFIPWEKNIEVKAGLVSEVKATLFPAIPSIYALTVNGVVNPSLSPDSQKLAFAVPYNVNSQSRQKGGIWVWTMSSQPIAISRSAEPHQLISSTPSLDFSKANIKWSPDSKQVLVTLQEGDKTDDFSQRNYLLSIDSQTNVADLRDITPSVAVTLKQWTEDQKTKDEVRVATITDLKLRKIASDSAVLRWSPDETKFMTGEVVKEETKAQGLRTTEGLQTKDYSNKAVDRSPLALSSYKNIKVYDMETADNGRLTYKEYSLPQAKEYRWLPDSRHIILIDDGKISIADYDGSNVAVIFAGSFEDSEVFPWPDSSRLAIVSSFNTPTASIPNLFGINLK